MASSEFSNNSDTSFNKQRRCFCFPTCVKLNWWNTEESVWSKGVHALKKLREWSEIVAGPRWKTFIRRFNRNKGGKNVKFQYDALSYSLNFDEGVVNNEEEEQELVLRNFSTRYASIPTSGKVSMDLSKDGTSFV